MKKYKILASIIVLGLNILWITALWATQDNNRTIPVVSGEALPSNYVRKDIPAQIGLYKTLLMPLYEQLKTKGEEDQLPAVHVPGLCEGMFKDAVTMIHDRLLQRAQEERSKRSPEEINPIIEGQSKALKTVWEVAQTVDKKSYFSLQANAMFMKWLARIADSINDVSVPDVGDYAAKANRVFGLKESQYGEAAKIFSESQAFSGQKTLLDMASVIPLQGNPKPVKVRGIAPKTFVKAYLEGDFPLSIALFDPLSVAGAEPSKQYAHNGIEEGVEQMLNHDLNHVQDTKNLENRFLSDDRINFRALLKHLYTVKLIYEERARKDPDQAAPNTNRANILDVALFLIFHEVFPSPGVRSDRAIIQDMVDNKRYGEALKALFSNVSKTVNNELNKTGSRLKFGTEYYKQEVRDWTKLLMLCRNPDDNKPFVPVIPINEKKSRPFPLGQKEGGNPFIVEEYEEGIEYPKNQKEAMSEELTIERNRLLKSAILKGWEDFWKVVESILDSDDPEVKAILFPASLNTIEVQ